MDQISETRYPAQVIARGFAMGGVTTTLSGIEKSSKPFVYIGDRLVAAELVHVLENELCGIVLAEGTSTNHIAVLARARGIPMLVGVNIPAKSITAHSQAIVDGEEGYIALNPSLATVEEYRSKVLRREQEGLEVADLLERPAKTRDGVQIKVYVNIDHPGSLKRIRFSQCDGVGLTRTEFFIRPEAFHDEDKQYGEYVGLLKAAKGLPVTIRTLDVGGGKHVPGLEIENETNPSLGVCGIRWTLKHLDVFRTQLRALARAAMQGSLRMVLPMVTVPMEVQNVRSLLEEEVVALNKSGVKAKIPPVGIMVEVPSAALGIDRFPADFLTIGTNDLIQYVTATDREAKQLAALYDPQNPAVLDLIERLTTYGAAASLEVSVCGEMAAQAAWLEILLSKGARAVSVAPTALADVKKTISSVTVL